MSTQVDVFDDVFGVPEDKATNGVWVNFGPKISVLIGFQGEANKNFVKAVELESAPYRRDIDNGTLSNEEGKILLARILSRGVTYNWKGDGLPVFSFDACVAQMLKPNSLFMQEVNEMSKRLATFRKAETERDAGNSTGASSQA